MIQKCRAWLLKQKLMFNIQGINYAKEEIAILMGEDGKFFIKPYFEPSDYVWLPFDKVVVMQSIGLKDRNDVEIFGSDLLNVDWGDGMVTTTVFWDETQFTWAVKYKGNEDIEYISELCAADIIVIGNIHETPELLEQS